MGKNRLMSSPFHFTDVGPIPIRHEFNRTAWVRLNRLRTSIRRFGSLMLKWGLTTIAASDCGAEQQILDHILYCRSIYKPTRKDGLSLFIGCRYQQLAAHVCPDINNADLEKKKRLIRKILNVEENIRFSQVNFDRKYRTDETKNRSPKNHNKKNSPQSLKQVCLILTSYSVSMARDIRRGKQL